MDKILRKIGICSDPKITWKTEFGRILDPNHNAKKWKILGDHAKLLVPHQQEHTHWTASAVSIVASRQMLEKTGGAVFRLLFSLFPANRHMSLGVLSFSADTGVTYFAIVPNLIGATCCICASKTSQQCCRLGRSIQNGNNDEKPG